MNKLLAFSFHFLDCCFYSGGIAQFKFNCRSRFRYAAGPIILAKAGLRGDSKGPYAKMFCTGKFIYKQIISMSLKR
jgi:hypothetical protein